MNTFLYQGDREKSIAILNQWPSNTFPTGAAKFWPIIDPSHDFCLRNIEK